MGATADCLDCDGRGRFPSGNLCPRCKGSGDEPPTGRELEEIARHAKEILGGQNKTDLTVEACRVTHKESESSFIVETNTGRRISLIINEKGVEVGCRGALFTVDGKPGFVLDR